MNICDIMTGSVVSVCEDESVFVAAREMKRNNVGALPVHDGKKRLRGIITDRDIVTRCVAADMCASQIKIGEIMSRNLVTAAPFDQAETAAKKMSAFQIRRLPVADNGILVGIVALGDVARRSEYEMEAAAALCEISSSFHRQ